MLSGLFMGVFAARGRRALFLISEGRASASLWAACPATILQRRVALKVAFPGGSSVPEGQVSLSSYLKPKYSTVIPKSPARSPSFSLCLVLSSVPMALKIMSIIRSPFG